MKRTVLLFAGVAFSVFNMLPIPWRLRTGWMRFLYFLTSKGTLWFPGVVSWTHRQNIAYQMGKQSGEDYESIVQLEMVLKELEKLGVPPQQVKRAVEQAEAENLSYEAYGAFITQAILETAAAQQVLREALQATRY